MSMNEIIVIALAGVAGTALGALFFAGLWWTLRRGLASSRPALWFFTSLLLRLSLTLAGFYWVAGDDWRRLLACLLGFLLARLLVTRLTRPAPMPAGRCAEEASHAP
ncbi:ATP synthase subunit I [Pseudomonas sp.]|uniref:ATP synthase subunit I n=1 Tax=Pseudomonas sp. TaxID=306 RepID=UPI00299F1E97|nr:ATP synthase subunit I [Pseudomonas sp.]MDX1365966.1 ATP synthase subunit I [Pseudomonas sp.]